MPKTTKPTLHREAKRHELDDVRLKMETTNLLQPVDPEKFCAAAVAFNAAGAAARVADAARTPIATVGLEGTPVDILDKPLNSAITAAAKTLIGLGVKDPAPYVWRLTTLQSLLEGSIDLFKEFVVVDGEKFRVAAAVMNGAAVARLTNEDLDSPGAFDVQDLLRAAREYERALPPAAVF